MSKWIIAIIIVIAIIVAIWLYKQKQAADNLKIDFGANDIGVTPSGVDFSIDVNITNPTTAAVKIDSEPLVVIYHNGKEIGSNKLSGQKELEIAPNKTTTFPIKITASWLNLGMDVAQMTIELITKGKDVLKNQKFQVVATVSYKGIAISNETEIAV